MTNEVQGWTLLLGPGERLESIHPLVAGAARSVALLEDLEDLGAHRGGSGALVIDADVLPTEDLGFLRRFLAREDGFSVTLVGEDSSRRVARTLLRLPRVRWMSWPPDLEDLRELVAPAPAIGGLVARARATGSTPRGVDRELESIESILEEPHPPAVAKPASATASKTPPAAGGAATAPAASARPAPSASPGPATASALAPAPAKSVASDRAAPRPPRYFRDQVADLADIAQRLEAGVASLSPPAERGPAAALSGDVARLVQFARTLSYVAAAPPQGQQVFDVSELLDLLVSGMVRKGPDAPRWLHRAAEELPIRSDRELLTQAFDALLVLADRSASAGQIVRALSRADAEAGLARVTIEFPAGALKDLEPEAILQPYALRRVFPDFGPNALAAAAGIFAGQGGRLELRRRPNGRLEWLVEIPLHEGGPTPGQGRMAGGASDPFA